MPNDLLLNISKKLNLTYNVKSNSLYGLYKNYNISLQRFSNILFITIPLKLNEVYTVNNINVFLQKLESNYASIETSIYKNYYISIKYNLYNESSSSNILISLINTIINEAYSYNLKTCCPQCGEKADINPFLVRYQIQLRCNICITKLEDNIKLSKKKNNFSFKPVLGAICGCFLGSALWFLLSYLNFFPIIAGLFIGSFSIIGYKLFAKKVSKLGYFVIFIISIIGVSIANYFSLGINIFYSEHYSNISDAIKDISYYIGSKISWNSIIKDLFIGYVLNFVAFITILITYNNRKESSLIESLH